MSEKKLKNMVGSWVAGETFWDRKVEVEFFEELLEGGANILLVAQRRIGKTSLMREVARRIGKKYTCLQVDLESCESAADAVVELSMATKSVRSIWGKIGILFSNVLGKGREAVEEIDVSEVKIKLRSGVTGGDWQVKGDRIFEILAGSEKGVVVFLDEVPILVNRMLKGDNYRITPERIREAEMFMSWLRENAMRHQGKVRVVITGSIGLEPVLRQAGLSATVNNFTSFELKPWDDDTAMDCLGALANEYGISYGEGVCELMVGKLGCCIPQHVQMFFQYAREFCKKKERNEFRLEDVEEVYEHSMLSTRGHVDLSHFEERLKMVLGPDVLGLALDLVTETAVTGRLTKEAIDVFVEEHKEQIDGRRPQEVLREVMEVLEHDGYLRSTGGGHVFVSKLLRDWWNRCFGQYFVRAAERRGKS